MKRIIEYIKSWLAPAPHAETDINCPHCRGLGYDASGYWCTCLKEKK